MYNYKKHLIAGHNPYKRKNIYAFAGQMNTLGLPQFGTQANTQLMNNINSLSGLNWLANQSWTQDNRGIQTVNNMNNFVGTPFTSALASDVEPTVLPDVTINGNNEQTTDDNGNSFLKGAGKLLSNISVATGGDVYQNAFNTAMYTGLNYAMPGLGHVAQLKDKLTGAAAKALSNGYSSDFGNVMEKIGGYSIPGVGDAAKFIGAAYNRIQGSKLNQENINNIQNQTDLIGSQNTLATTNSSLLNDFNNMEWGDDFTTSDVGKDASGKVLGIKMFSGGHKAKDKYNQLQEQRKAAQNRAMTAFNNRVSEVQQRNAHNAMMNYMACGGRLFDNGGLLFNNDLIFDNNLMYINEGGTHEQSPYNGVPVSYDEEGNPNLVEEGEVVFGHNYVFSDRLKVPDKLAKHLKIGKGKTFAKAVRTLAKESEELPNDPIIKRGLQDGLEKLAVTQEQLRNQMQEKEYAEGGSIHINPANKGKFTASANAAGMGVQEFANHVLANKDDYSPTQVKRANFAKNAAGWKHDFGGFVGPYSKPNGEFSFFDTSGTDLPNAFLYDGSPYYAKSDDLGWEMRKAYELDQMLRSYDYSNNQTDNNKNVKLKKHDLKAKTNDDNIDGRYLGVKPTKVDTNHPPVYYNDNFALGGNLFPDGGDVEHKKTNSYSNEGSFYDKLNFIDKFIVNRKLYTILDSEHKKIIKELNLPYNKNVYTKRERELYNKRTKDLYNSIREKEAEKYLKEKESNFNINSGYTTKYDKSQSFFNTKKRQRNIVEKAERDIRNQREKKELQALKKEYVFNREKYIKDNKNKGSYSELFQEFNNTHPYYKDVFENAPVSKQRNIVQDTNTIQQDEQPLEFYQEPSAQTTTTKTQTQPKQKVINSIPKQQRSTNDFNWEYALGGNLFNDGGKYLIDEKFLNSLKGLVDYTSNSNTGRLGYDKLKTGDINDVNYKKFTDYIYDNWGNWGDNTSDVLTYLNTLNDDYVTTDENNNLVLNDFDRNYTKNLEKGIPTLANGKISAKDYWKGNRNDKFWGRHHYTPLWQENIQQVQEDNNPPSQAEPMSVVEDNNQTVTQPNHKSQEQTPKENLELDPLANLAYAPTIGSAINLAENYFKGPDFKYANQYDNIAQQMGKPITMPVDVLGNYRKKNPFDERYLVNMNNQNANAYARTGQNISGGNRAAQLGYAKAGHFAQQQNEGEIMRQAYLANRQDDADVDTFNRATNEFNATANNARNQFVNQINNQKDLYSKQGQMQASQLRQNIQDQYDKAINEDKANIYNTLGDIGRIKEWENQYRNLVNWGVLHAPENYQTQKNVSPNNSNKTNVSTNTLNQANDSTVANSDSEAWNPQDNYSSFVGPRIPGNYEPYGVYEEQPPINAWLYNNSKALGGKINKKSKSKKSKRRF